MSKGWFRKGDEERRHHVSREPEPESEEFHEIGVGYQLHIFKAEEDGEWVVWLNTEASDFDGLVIGKGKTRQEAVAEAMKVVEAMEAVLQGPPPEVGRG